MITLLFCAEPADGYKRRAERTARTHTRPVRERKISVSKITNARDALADWGRGMETYCLTFGQFSLMDAIEAILERTGPADVAIATWTAGSADLSRSAESLRNGNIRSLRFVVDCSFGQRQPGYLPPVPYTHLPLPTNKHVYMLLARGPLKITSALSFCWQTSNQTNTSIYAPSC